MPKGRLIGFIFISAVIGAVIFAYLRSHPSSEAETVKVTRDKVIRAVYATGTVEPVYWAKLAPHQTGRLIDIVRYEGDEIAKGDVIARMENRVEKEQLAAAKARLDFANSELRRNQSLSQQNAISRKQLEDSQREQKEAQAEVFELQRELDDLTLVAPVGGIVLRRDVELGETVQAGEVIFWVGQQKPLRITADVDEEDIARVATGQTVLIKADAFPGQVFEGHVKEITPKGDPVNKVFRIRVSLPDKVPFLAGMTTEVNIITETVPNALVVPVTSESGGFVWKLENGDVEKTPVKIGIRGESHIQILEGLNEGDMILRTAKTSSDS